MGKTIRLLVIAMWSLACAGSGAAVGSNNPVGTKVVTVNEDFDLPVGATAEIDGGELLLTFVKVAEDSRCPTGVQCVWAGNGAVILTVAPSTAAKYSVTLHTTLTPKAAVAGSYQVSLVGLKPYPKQGSTIPAPTYVATLKVVKQ